MDEVRRGTDNELCGQVEQRDGRWLALTGFGVALGEHGRREVAPVEIAALLRLPPEQACRARVDAAYEAGSRDNISAIVVRCV